MLSVGQKMSARSFQDRWAENVPGKFYVDQQCLDCELCAELAHGHFSRNDAGGYFYVSRQPNTTEEDVLLQQAVESCPCEAIFSDGDQFDWPASPTVHHDDVDTRKKKIEQKQCPHCSANSNKWWEFWK